MNGGARPMPAATQPVAPAGAVAAAQVAPAGAVAVLAAVVVALAGCAGPGHAAGPDDAFAVVAGAHANAPAPVALGAVADAIDSAVRTRASAAVVVNAGEPVVLSQGSLDVDCRNEASCAQADQAGTAMLTSALAGARAQSPENNLLAALDLAARTLADHSGTRTLAVIDSGLQSVGGLRFPEPGALAAEPSEVADYLARTHQLPDLAGVALILSGLGDTVAPQRPLSRASRANLTAIWEAVLRRAGASEVRVVQAPVTGAAAPGLPPVTPVPVAEPVAFVGSVVELPETVLPFERDTAVLRDPAAARLTLREVAARITAAHTPVTLTGATANVGPLDGQRALGRDRADAVRAILVELGVSPELLHVRGVGSDWPGYVQDRDAGGTLLPAPAARNRRVLVTLDNP